ncbi:MAG: serine hydrolase domain-containing protein [Actinomycetes bacterium]
MNLKRTRSLVVGGAIAAVLVSLAPLTSPALAAPDTTAMDAAAAKYLATDGTSSAVYVAVYNAKTGVQMKAYGEASPGVPATVKDHFEIGSITKTAFATAVLQQVQKGVIGLDDTVKKAAPRVAKRYPKAANYTVRELLSMNTRIGDYADTSVMKVFADPTTLFTRPELVKMGFAAKPMPKEGGYSTTNYIILGDVMREVTGRSPIGLVNGVLKQAGMKDSLLTVIGTKPAPATHGYLGAEYGPKAATVNPALNADTDVTAWPMTWGREGGGAYATLPDLYTWAKSCAGNKYLSPAMIAQREKTHKIDAGNYGLGIIHQDGYWGHTGQGIGYEALVTCNPKTGDVVAIAVNDTSSLMNAVGAFGPTVFPDYLAAYAKTLF